MSHFQGIEVPVEVVRAAQAGDARAHETIYRTCRRPIYTLIRRLVVRTAIADELFHRLRRVVGPHTPQRRGG